MAVERTFLMVKPDGVQRGLVGEHCLERRAGAQLSLEEVAQPGRERRGALAEVLQQRLAQRLRVGAQHRRGQVARVVPDGVGIHQQQTARAVLLEPEPEGLARRGVAEAQHAVGREPRGAPLVAQEEVGRCDDGSPLQVRPAPQLRGGLGQKRPAEHGGELCDGPRGAWRRVERPAGDDAPLGLAQELRQRGRGIIAHLVDQYTQRVAQPVQPMWLQNRAIE